MIKNKFIQLTLIYFDTFEKKEKIFRICINKNKICKMISICDNTRIYLDNGDDFYVKESIEEILNLIDRGKNE